jgi:hypothetical protein
MPATPDLWSTVVPLTCWVTISAPETGEHVDRVVSLRVQRPPLRSITVTARADIYSSEGQILLACSMVVSHLETLQGPLDRDNMLFLLTSRLASYVDPF